MDTEFTMRKLQSTLLALTFIVLGTGLTTAQEKAPAPKQGDKKDAFVKDPKATPNNDEAILEVGILIEYIRLDHRTANQLIRDHAIRSANAQELRDKLETMMDAKTATLEDTLWLRTLSGQRAKTESISERIYPTEYDPPEIPSNAGSVTAVEAKEKSDQVEADRQADALNAKLPPTEGVFPMTSANPTAFETRNLGVTLEIDPVVSSDSKSIDLNLAPEVVEELEKTHYLREGFEHTAKGIDHIEMPTFYTRKITTQITVIPGNYNLLNIQRPHDGDDERILVFLRADLIPVK